MKRLDGSIEIVRMLMSRRISPQVCTCNALISEVSKCCGASKGYEVYKEMEEALKLQAEMVGKGFKLNLEIYDAFIDGYLRQGNEEMLEQTCLNSDGQLLGGCFRNIGHGAREDILFFVQKGCSLL
ncbi:hypothetical protein GOBAR_DD26010 [Gossypium barbadense]|nr:hypothetical protein GOBAR_DD26010 [Gossypium barbadense]